MNILRGAVSLVAAVSWTITLIRFSIGSFYPTKFFIGFAIILSITLFLTWSTNSFKKVAEKS